MHGYSCTGWLGIHRVARGFPLARTVVNERVFFSIERFSFFDVVHHHEDDLVLVHHQGQEDDVVDPDRGITFVLF